MWRSVCKARGLTTPHVEHTSHTVLSHHSQTPAKDCDHLLMRMREEGRCETSFLVHTSKAKKLCASVGVEGVLH